VHIDAVAIVPDAEGRPLAVVILRSNAETYLYPLIQSWPTPSRSAETLLVQRDGEGLVFLNELRHKTKTALTLREPLTLSSLPAVQAVLGKKGRFEGKDYRSMKVLADLRPIPGTPWFMVAKVDADEILAEARYRAGVIVVIVAALILLAAAATALLYRHRQAQILRDRYESERRKREAQETFRATLYSIGDAVITADATGRIREMNPVAEKLTGWSEAEARGKLIEEIFRIVNEETRATVENPVQRVLRDGVVVGLANHTLLIARDGTERPIADSAAPIRHKLAAVSGVVLVFRDQTEERIAQRALVDSEERLRIALAAANQGLYDLNVQTGECTVSPEYARMLGYDPADFRETNDRWRERLHPDDREAVYGVYREYVAGQRDEYRIEFRQRTRGGEWKWILSVGKVVEHSADGKPLRLLGTHTDITELKRTEKELMESEARFRVLVEGAPEAIFVQSAGRFAYLNPAACRLLGALRPEDLLGKDFMGRIAPEYHDKIQERISLQRETGEPAPLMEQVYLRLDGRRVPVEATAVSIRYQSEDAHIVFVRDITERVKAENELRESYERYRLVADFTYDWEYWVDPEGKFIYVSPSCERVSGYPPDFFLNEPDALFKIVHPEDQFKIESHMNEPVVRGANTDKIRFRIITQTGETRWIDHKCWAVFSSEGTFMGRRGSNRDITQRLQLENQLRQAQKMEAVGRLAGGVAHDFNNMLGVILGFTDLAITKLPADDPLQMYLGEVKSAAQRSADITRQLLAFARKQTIAPKVLDLNDTIASMLKMLRRLIGEDIDLLWKPANDLWPVKMDPAQIDQILANLMVNSRDAIAGVGKITIETGKAEFDQNYCEAHLGFVPGRYVLLAVSDDGCGMDKETLAKLFEPFFTTKEVGKGTGLGLATIYGIVKQNNGFINVYSEPGQGTTFKIYLPRQEPQDTATEHPRQPAETPTGTETVLLVEDEKSLLKFARMLLEELGYTVLAAGSPREAIELAKKYTNEIHLLMTDVVMPEMSGRDLLEKLKASQPGLKCLFMSGYTANVIAHHGVLDEGVHFLQKPFSRRALATKIREALL
jgi:PAS domain S-box-containing protein